jgi:hypothetical protein
MRSVARAAAAAMASVPLLACLAFAGLSGCVLDTPYDKYAIVYGVSIYDPANPENDGLGPNLIFPNEDADAMAAMLLGQGFQVVERINQDATLDKLENEDVPFIAGLAQEQDLFVFYFSGHGGYAGTGPEPSGANSPTEWIYLRDSIVAPWPYSFDYSKTLSDDQLVGAFSNIKARRKVIILDSCNSGGFIGNELEADGEPPSLVGDHENIVDLAARAIRLYANFDGSTADIPPWQALVLAAAGERELSFEMDLPFEHGVLTFYLLQSESFGDLDQDGWVTVTEAFAYAQEMIYRYWNQTAYGSSYGYFSPHVSGGPVDYVLFEAR